jgi:formylmethanofuran dehydrogenase subunit E-like metal-binding protein
MALPEDPRARSSDFQELYAQAAATREQSQAVVREASATWAKVSAEWQRVEARWHRAEHVRELWLTHASQQQDRMFSASARMQAQLASMPVIEQAKGIIMAECGYTADQAYDALRRAAMRSRLHAQDVAATIVARTAGSEGPPYPSEVAANRA